MSLPSIQRGSLVTLAIERLREPIVAGTWAVGDRVPSETALTEMLGVGRSTLREAVRALVQDGLLEVRHGSGTFVASDTSNAWQPLVRRAAVLEVYEVRAGLETQAARLAAMRATHDDIARIDAALQARLSVPQHPADAFVEVDLAFHRAVVAAAHNHLLDQLYDSFVPALRDGLAKLAAGKDLDPDTSRRVRTAHIELADAIRNRDVAGAVTATGGNLDVTADALRPEPTDD